MMEDNFEKIEIPAEPEAKPKTIQDSAKSMADLMKLSITEEKQMVPLDTYKWVAELETNSVIYIIKKIQDESEIINTHWHFIPYEIPPEKRAEHNRKSGFIQFFCVDDTKILKRYTKKIKKYFPFSIVDWHPFDYEEYNKEKKQLKNS